MKVVTFNIDWANKNSSVKNKIESLLINLNADILVINEAIELDLLSDYRILKSIQLPEALFEDVDYKRLLKGKAGYRTIIYSKYPVVRTFNVADPLTAVAAELVTEYGLFTIYGTIIGTRFFANRYSSKELLNVVNDCKNMLAISNHFALVGDLNTAFLNGEEDYQIKGLNTRQVLLALFEEHGFINTTRDICLNIDHVVVSKSFSTITSAEHNIFVPKRALSDHHGVLVTFEKNFS